MAKCFNGLTTVNIELTTRCNKDCWMCGRRKVERDCPEIAIDYGDMEFGLVKSIAEQLPEGIVIQLHNNGESLLYPRFGEAAKLFTKQIRCLDTNGKLLMEKADEIINNLDTVTISVIENDHEADEQYRVVKKFLKIKKNKKPIVIFRLLGKIDAEKYKKLGCIVVTRILHSPMGSFNYGKNPTIPEIGICLDFLNHMVICKNGEVSTCVRFDPHKLGIIGDCRRAPLVNIWNNPKRKKWLKNHMEGRRDKIPLCRCCEFWGVPTG